MPTGCRLGGYTIDELVAAKEELEALYEWLSQSPAGEDHDLHGLDTAITVLSKLIGERKRIVGA